MPEQSLSMPEQSLSQPVHHNTEPISASYIPGYSFLTKVSRRLRSCSLIGFLLELILDPTC